MFSDKIILTNAPFYDRFIPINGKDAMINKTEVSLKGFNSE